MSHEFYPCRAHRQPGALHHRTAYRWATLAGSTLSDERYQEMQEACEQQVQTLLALTRAEREVKDAR